MEHILNGNTVTAPEINWKGLEFCMCVYVSVHVYVGVWFTYVHWVYKCMCIDYVWFYICACTWMCMCLYVEPCEFECICMHVCIYVSSCVCMLVSVSMCTYLWLCVHIRTYGLMPVFSRLSPFLLHSLLTPLITEVAPHKAAGLLCLIESSCRFTVWHVGDQQLLLYLPADVHVVKAEPWLGI